MSFYILFASAGAVTWSVIVAPLAVLRAVAPRSSSVLALIGLGWALVNGAGEMLFSQYHAPESRWQVPRRWIPAGESGRVVLWAFSLGGGLMTRNPFASYWLCFPVLGCLHRPALVIMVAAIVGALHGLARATGIRSGGSRSLSSGYLGAGIVDHLTAKWMEIRWRRVDGVLLMAACPMLVIFLLQSG